MFQASKVLPLLVLPVGIVTGLLLFALWRKQRWPVGVALAVLYLGSIPFVADRLVGGLESRYPAVPLAEVEAADAVVVLGGILGPRVGPGYVPNWTETAERFEAGVALVQSGKAGRLVFTGARMNRQDPAAPTEGAELQRLALARGIAPDRIVVTRDISNTATEAAAVAGLMQAQGWKRVILVTTGWHMPRSAYLFAKAGVDFTPFPVDFRRDRSRRVRGSDFVPKGEAWQLTETVLREYYGYWFYRVFR
jgi:uncharacterized SAM-binding protein YcdF (DUF218 family)